MFTGIVEELGEVTRLSERSGIVRLTVGCSRVLEGTRVGDSIAVNGVCLTVVETGRDSLAFDVTAETRRASTFSAMHAGDRVNLERSLKAGDRVSGHFVLGHVDCAGVIRRKQPDRGALVFEVGVPPRFLRWCVERGSVAVDGISLTVTRITPASFEVCIIPHTASVTTLGLKHAGEKVNVEFDMLLKGKCATL